MTAITTVTSLVVGEVGGENAVYLETTTEGRPRHAWTNKEFPNPTAAPNQVMAIGWNHAQGGTREDESKHGIWIAVESGFEHPDTSIHSEGFFQYYGADGTSRRFIGGTVNTTTHAALVAICGRVSFQDDDGLVLLRIQPDGVIACENSDPYAGFYKEGDATGALYMDLTAVGAREAIGCSATGILIDRAHAWAKCEINTALECNYPITAEQGIAVGSGWSITGDGGKAIARSDVYGVYYGTNATVYVQSSTTYWNPGGGVFIGVVTPDGLSLNNGSTPVGAGVALEIGGTNKGWLPPRLTTTQRNAIASPPVALGLYNTTLGCSEEWDGANWRRGSFVQQPDVGALTSNGASADRMLVDVTTIGVADPAKVNANFDDLADAVNDIRTALRAAGVMA